MWGETATNQADYKAAAEATCLGPDYAVCEITENQVLSWELSQLNWGNDLTLINFEVVLWLQQYILEPSISMAYTEVLFWERKMLKGWKFDVSSHMQTSEKWPQYFIKMFISGALLQSTYHISLFSVLSSFWLYLDSCFQRSLIFLL